MELLLQVMARYLFNTNALINFSMKFKTGVLVGSFLLFANYGFCQIADSMLRADSKNHVNNVQQAPVRGVAEILADSLNKAIMIQAARENPEIKSTAAYQTMMTKDNVAAIKTESSESEATKSKGNTAPQ